MTPTLRKFALTTHITFSVGWFGAIAGFLALAVAGLVNKDLQIVRSAYLSMELIGWFIIVPACLGSLLSGIIQSLGTHWGLFRHYWVVVKLLLTVAATILLLVHMRPIGFIAEIVSKRTISNSEFDGLRIQLVADAIAASFILLAAIILSVYKPWGRTSYGLTKIQERTSLQINPSVEWKSWKLFMWIVVICLALLFIILHLKGGGLGNH